jgi:hypothetical protein
MTRQERRAQRQRRFVTDKEARLAARLARLDYRTTGESGALKVPSTARIWHKGGRLNGHRPRPGQPWDRSGPAYVVETESEGRLPEPVQLHIWRQRRGQP